MIYYDLPINLTLQKFLCFDIGSKKTGIAHNFEMNTIASPYKTIETHKIAEEIILLQKHDFEYIVIGLPTAYPESSSYQFIESFVILLQSQFPEMHFIFWDETGTSQTIREQYKYGRKGFRKKFYANYDSKAATLILADLIDFINIPS